MITTVREVIAALERIAPPQYQEDYDNAGLLTGRPEWPVTGVLCCLDATEAVLQEAVAKGCNLVVAHHPIVFRGLKKITGRNYVERVVIRAIKEDLAIYAIHTNLDNVYQQGVNTVIADRIGLQETSILAPKRVNMQLSACLPATAIPALQQSLSGIGELQLSLQGGGLDQLSESRLELVFPAHVQSDVRRRLSQFPVSNVSYFSTEEDTPTVGAGMIGHLPQPMEPMDFLHHLRRQMHTACIRYTQLPDRPISKVAVCGGAGSFLLPKALALQADAFVTADYKYHEFFDADGQLLIADIGHYESEQFTVDLLCNIIREKFVTFAAFCAETTTNPVRYLC
jgi:dinuclear metal center YbgI/SA1388 family protein